MNKKARTLNKNNKIHIHKVVQQQKKSYKAVRLKYGEHIDEDGFLPSSVLKMSKKRL